MLQRPGAIEDIREVMQRMLQDPTRRARFNASVERVETAKDGVDADPFARLLAEPQSLAGMLQDPSRAQELVSSLNGSALFEDMRELGSAVLDQMRIKKLEAGAPVELCGLKAQPELNGISGTLAAPTPAEAEAFPGRRVVQLDGGDRIAVQLENLIFPRHRVGDAVTLEAEFMGEEEGLEGRAAVLSELTEEERELGFSGRGGRLVVDVLPLIPGGPVTTRLLMWPEHLRPRRFQPGDGVELTGLESDDRLNGLQATVVPATAEEEPLGVGHRTGRIVVVTDADGLRLTVRRKNVRLVSVGLPTVQGLG